MGCSSEDDWKEEEGVFFFLGNGDEDGVMEYIHEHPDCINAVDEDGRR